MKLIKITQGLFTKVDDEDFDRLSQFRWWARKDKTGKIYVQRKARVSASTRKNIGMHAEIAGTPSGFQTDHINGDTLDNQSSNLRICTTSQNGMNRGKPKNNTSGFKGIVFDKRKRAKPWIAKIKKDFKSIYIGTYETALEAALAYDIAAKEIHGEFAQLNFPSLK